MYRSLRPRASLLPVASITAAALVLAGCGGDGGSGRSGASDGDGDRRDEPVEIREVTTPEPDESLTRDLGDAATKLEAAGCTAGTYQEAAARHVDDGAKLEGTDFPPTTGDHYDRWAPFGAYDEPVEDGYLVHNLEHGGVGVLLGTEVDEQTTEAVEDLLDKGEKWVVVPRRDIEGLFSSAWTKGLSCPPAALDELGAEGTADLLEDWYDAVVSTGSDAEKDLPAFAGGMKEPAPTRDISEPSPF